MITGIALTIGLIFVAIWIYLLWPIRIDAPLIERDVMAIRAAHAATSANEHTHRPGELPARHVLTDEGVFIPDLTPKENRLLRVTSREWADNAAREVDRVVARARYYAKNPPTSPHPWLDERAQLIADGHEQWLLWMEYDPQEDQ